MTDVREWRCRVGDHQWTAIGDKAVCVFCKRVRGAADEFPEDYPAGYDPLKSAA